VKLFETLFDDEKQKTQNHIESKTASFSSIDHKSKSINFYKYFSIAASIVLALSIGINLQYYSKLKSSEKLLLSINEKNLELADNSKKLQVRWKNQTSSYETILNTQAVRVTLKGLKDNPNSEAIVFYSLKENSVFLQIKNLPKAPEGKQYQLWAIDEKPIDAGVFESESDTIIKMKSSVNAKAFAVTIEPIGGSKTPSLDLMVLIGQVFS
jgi:anti-sigma-K factor RskA